MPPSVLNTKPKILVVDDQEIIRYTMDTVLTQQGYRAVLAENLAEGVELLGSQRPDLVLLDLSMPGGDGLALLRQMRQSQPFRNTPVIILTGHSDRGFVAEALSLGVRDYVLKAGFLIDDLLARVRQRLEDCGALAPTVRPRTPLPPGSKLPAPSRMELADFLEGLQGKAFPSSRNNVLTACASPLTSLSEVESLLHDDPILAAAVMASAQAALSRARPLPRLMDALQLLGLSKVGEAVAATKVYGDDEELPEDILRTWAHALFCTRWMERFCPDQPAAALIGLCHDLPKILLMQRLPTEQWISLRESARGSGKFLTRIVEEVFGLPYGEFAGAVFQRLGLPPALVTPMQEYVNAYQNSSPVPPTRDALRLSTANQWAHALSMAANGGVAVSLPRRDELEPRLLTEDIAQLPLLCDDSWNIASRAVHGLRLPLGGFRLPFPPVRPRLVLAMETWVASPSPLERLLAELGVLQRGSVESLQKYEWDAFIYLGDHPVRLFPEGFPYIQPLVVLHQLPTERCSLPPAARLETLRLPTPLSQLFRLFELLGS